MPEQIAISPCGPIRASIRPPGSKSITNRALICAGLARGVSTLTGALDSDDTRAMINGWRELGVHVEVSDHGQQLTVEGCDGSPPAREAEIFCGNSGTTIRFLTAACALGKGCYRLDGIERMRQRPIGDLLRALEQLGCQVRSEFENDCPPVVIEAAGLPGGRLEVAGDISSQYLSGLLMAAPCAASEVEITVAGTLVSQPYVEMTLAVMESFGAKVQTSGLQKFRVPAGGGYRGREYAIEPDASAASYFWAAAAVTGGQVTVEGLTRESLQGDVAFCDCLEQMGCQIQYGDDFTTVTGEPLVGIDVDMNAISDTVPTLAVVALSAVGPTTIRGVAHIRHKETDRIGDLARELRKLGADVKELPDGLHIVPGKRTGATIDTYDDHRMAMSFAVAGLAQEGVVINDPGCTAKTYPKFFSDLARVCGG